MECRVAAGRAEVGWVLFGDRLLTWGAAAAAAGNDAVVAAGLDVVAAAAAAQSSRAGRAKVLKCGA